MKKAFTLIELVFVIVVLGILASVAIPKLTATRVDAVIARGATDVGAIRAGMALYGSEKLLQGFTKNIYENEDDKKNSLEDKKIEGLFSKILTTPIRSKTSEGGWMKDNSDTYSYYITNSEKVTFSVDYEKNTFTCDTTKNYCSDLSK